MQTVVNYIEYAASQCREILAETFWPTRCAICNKGGRIICNECLKKLPFIDVLFACRHCGSPYGVTQCDYCNPVSLASIHLNKVPFMSCSSVVSYTDEVGRLIKTYKDQGEQRLANFIAYYMARYISPAYKYDCITYIPSSLKAYVRRGFDHCELVARCLSRYTHIPVKRLLNRPKTADQRMLTGKQRVENLQGAFSCRSSGEAFGHILLIDDVFTGGATVGNASKALVGEVAKYVHVVTFARVINHDDL